GVSGPSGRLCSRPGSPRPNSHQPGPSPAATATTASLRSTSALSAVKRNRPSGPVVARTGRSVRALSPRADTYTLAPRTGLPSGSSTRPVTVWVAASSLGARCRSEGGDGDEGAALFAAEASR